MTIRTLTAIIRTLTAIIRTLIEIIRTLIEMQGTWRERSTKMTWLMYRAFDADSRRANLRVSGGRANEAEGGGRHAAMRACGADEMSGRAGGLVAMHRS
jgi:hypothetical protein